MTDYDHDFADNRGVVIARYSDSDIDDANDGNYVWLLWLEFLCSCIVIISSLFLKMFTVHKLGYNVTLYMLITFVQFDTIKLWPNHDFAVFTWKAIPMFLPYWYATSCTSSDDSENTATYNINLSFYSFLVNLIHTSIVK